MASKHKYVKLLLIHKVLHRINDIENFSLEMVKTQLFILCLPLLICIGCSLNKTDRAKETPTDEVTTSDHFTGKDSIKDAQGNIYQTVKIGYQVWMAENLRNTLIDCAEGQEMQFTNGIERGPGTKFYDGTPRFAYYNNDQESGLGVIYNFAAIQHCRLCPDGFRVPTKADWETLIEHLGGEYQAGKKLLEGGSSGFNAQLAGRIDDYGSVTKGDLEFWWSDELKTNSNKFKAFTFEINAIGVIKLIGQDIRVGNYVRCVKE